MQSASRASLHAKKRKREARYRACYTGLTGWPWSLHGTDEEWEKTLEENLETPIACNKAM